MILALPSAPASDPSTQSMFRYGINQGRQHRSMYVDACQLSPLDYIFSVFWMVLWPMLLHASGFLAVPRVSFKKQVIHIPRFLGRLTRISMIVRDMDNHVDVCENLALTPLAINPRSRYPQYAAAHHLSPSPRPDGDYM